MYYLTVQYQLKMSIKDDTEHEEIYAIHVTNEENNIEWLKQRLNKVWSCPKFCGVCLEDSGNLYSLEMEFIFGRQTTAKSLQYLVNYLFNGDFEDVMSSSHICEQCAERTIQSYQFIHSTKQTAKVINNCVNDVLSKVIDIDDKLQESTSYENANVMIVLETDSEINEYIDDITTYITEIIPKEKNNITKTIEIPKDILKVFEQDKRPEVNVTKSSLETQATPPQREPKSSQETVSGEFKKPKPIIRQIPVNKKPAKDHGTPNITLKEGKIIIKPLTSLNGPNLTPIFNTYRCTRCPDIFTTYKSLKDHEKQKHMTFVYRCNICNKSYNTQQYLNVHLKTHDKARCKICRIILPEGDFLQHLRNKHEKVVQICKFCDQVYYSPESLETHFKTTHLVNDIRSQSQCIMCLRNFNEDEINKHRCKFFCPECTVMPCIHHSFLMSYREQILNHVSKVKCVECDYSTRRKEYLISHANREHLGHHPFTCDDCGQQFYTKMSLKTHIVQFHQDLCICEYCDSVLKDKNKLDAHRKACKVVIRSYGCDTCVASFDTEQEYEKHVDLRHNDGVYPCKLCKREFTTLIKLDEHHARVHSGIQCKKRRKFIECTLCDTRFNDIRELVQHEQLHGPNVKYPCKVCTKEYNSLKKLYLHKQRHYTERLRCPTCNKTVTANFYPQHAIRCAYKSTSTSKSHICETCGKIFQAESMLKIHQRIHLKPEPCTLCNKLVKPTYFKKHMDQFHSDTKPPTAAKIKGIYCDLCGHAMRKKCDLEAHMNRYHLKIKPFVCHICSKDFCGKMRLKEHLATHTSDNSCFCSVCGKKFANRVCLKMHFRMHTGENPYSCDICGEKFRSSSIMKTHRLKKHLEKTVCCPLCDSMFYIVRDMRHHFKKVHWKFKDRPFNPTEVKELDEKYYHLFEDGRLPRLDADS